MTAFMLSPDRRDQLATLLADEVRLQTEYPKVAEYLDTAAGLPGGPDPEQDRLLDLRMLHFLSGGESSNPYWDIVEPLLGEGADGRQIPGGGAGTARMGYTQTVLQETYAYAIPSPGTLDWMVEAAGGRGICEVGAGRGYWAAMLADRLLRHGDRFEIVGTPIEGHPLTGTVLSEADRSRSQNPLFHTREDGSTGRATTYRLAGTSR
ncbi:hypothetical protein ATM97_26155 [Nocardia sp. MH4]|uniref:hypothetical protein n=1 Tax=Nocardia sp. MH4 TaxID=1768677 RepID=UPI001C4E6775|nr:hypothetical protein [Nocardia sp. MH4]MBW0273565.1 hypothetical protein [Nocardia sp. MH4]